jgi:hypothetical protein
MECVITSNAELQKIRNKTHAFYIKSLRKTHIFVSKLKGKDDRIARRLDCKWLTAAVQVHDHRELIAIDLAQDQSRLNTFLVGVNDVSGVDKHFLIFFSVRRFVLLEHFPIPERQTGRKPMSGVHM